SAACPSGGSFPNGARGYSTLPWLVPRLRSCRLLGPPRGGLVGLAPGLVQSDDAGYGLTHAGRERVLGGLHPRVAGQQKRLGLGMAALGGQRTTQDALRLPDQPVVRGQGLAPEVERLAQVWLGLLRGALADQRLAQADQAVGDVGVARGQDLPPQPQ